MYLYRWVQHVLCMYVQIHTADPLRYICTYHVPRHAVPHAPPALRRASAPIRLVEPTEQWLNLGTEETQLMPVVADWQMVVMGIALLHTLDAVVLDRSAGEREVKTLIPQRKLARLSCALDRLPPTLAAP